MTIAVVRVLEITFPGDFIDTPTGRVNGSGVAKITVAGETFRGVPLW